jgi:hypothetical protein
VQMGNLRARWTDVCSVLLASDAKTVQGPGAVRRKVLRDMNTSKSNKSQSMLELLVARRGLGATDPRDIVFAHWSMALDRSELEKYMQIDYSKSWRAIYENTARYFLERMLRDRCGNIFWYLDDKEPAYRPDGLASWAPDWSKPGPGLAPLSGDTLDQAASRKDSILPYVFVGDPWVFAFKESKADIIKDTSLMLPHPAILGSSSRAAYEQAVRELKGLYHRIGVVCESDMYMPITASIRNFLSPESEAEHIKLCLKLVYEWIEMMGKYLPEVSLVLPADELKSHERVLDKLRKRLQHRASAPAGIKTGSYDEQFDTEIYNKPFDTSIYIYLH